MSIFPIISLSHCRAAVDLQIDVWGAGAETVPASVLLVSAKRGGILLGAFEDDQLIGFVWSMPGLHEGRTTQWSHMLAVAAAARGAGVGEMLKREQRLRVQAQGIDLIEWTFDPLQAANAHLNVHRLGATATTYMIDAYGEQAGPLHRGTPTDRLIAEWWIDTPHVERRLRASAGSALQARSVEVAASPIVGKTKASGAWIEWTGGDADVAERRVRVPIPPRFTEMQQQAPELALAWRLGTRQIFGAYLSRGYRVVDFFADADRRGTYLLALPDVPR